MGESHEVRAAYDAIAADYATHFPSTEPEAAIDLAILDHFVALLSLDRPQVLDAGCGTGRIGRYLTDRGCQVTGVDLSAGMVTMASRHHPDLRVAVGSMTRLPTGDERFDGAVYWYSMIHLPDEALPRIFAEAARVVRPGGHVVVAFQGGDGIRDIGEAFRRFGHDVRLERHHRSLDVVLAVAAAHGLYPVAQLTRGPIGAERDPQAFAILRREWTSKRGSA